MSLPSNVTTITVTGSFYDLQGNALPGTVQFIASSSPFADPTAPAFLSGVTVTATLSAGKFTVVLPCTDNTTLAPTGFVYTVVETVSGDSRQYLISLPHTLGPAVDLATLSPVATLPNVSAYGLLGSANTWTASNTFTGGLVLNATTIANPPGGTTTFLRGDGTWVAPAGGVQLAGDLGGTNNSPQVIGTHLASPLPLAQGGTASTTQQAAINALTGSQSAGRYLRSDGNNATLSAIAAADLPAGTTSTQGALRLDATASDLLPSGVATAGATGKAADGGHGHPLDAWQFNVMAYGAKGDGQVVTDGAMSLSGSTLTCATSTPFASSDVGKAIMVKGAAATGITSLVTTISAYTSASQVTLAASAGTAVTSATVLWATDDTAAFQSAVNAATTYAQAHSGYAEVVVPSAVNRFFGIAGALSHANSGNAQVTLPVIPVTADCVTLVFTGQQSGNAIRHWLQTTPQISGSCLVSFGVYSSTTAQVNDINANGQSAMIGGPTGPNGYGTATFLFSNMEVVFRGLSLVTTQSSFGIGYGAAWLWGVIQANLVDVGYGTTGVYNNGNGDFGGSGVSTLASGASIGIGLPATSNQNNIAMDRVTCGGGYTYGLLATEHSDLHGCHIFYCWAGLCPVGSWHDGSATANTSSHKIKFTQVGIEGCAHSLFVLGSGAAGIGPFIEGSIDSESGLAWADDGNNGLAHALGEIHLSGTTGGSLTTSTGTGLAIIDQRSANGPGSAWSLTVGTAFGNPQWRWANVILTGGTSLTGIQMGALRGGPSAPAMTSYYTQSAGALPPISVRVPPSGWIEVTGTGSPTAPTVTVVYD